MTAWRNLKSTMTTTTTRRVTTTKRPRSRGHARPPGSECLSFSWVAPWGVIAPERYTNTRPRRYLLCSGPPPKPSRVKAKPRPKPLSSPASKALEAEIYNNISDMLYDHVQVNGRRTASWTRWRTKRKKAGQHSLLCSTSITIPPPDRVHHVRGPRMRRMRQRQMY